MIGLTEVISVESARKGLLAKAPKGTEQPNEIAFNLGYEAAKELLK